MQGKDAASKKTVNSLRAKRIKKYEENLRSICQSIPASLLYSLGGRTFSKDSQELFVKLRKQKHERIQTKLNENVLHMYYTCIFIYFIYAVLVCYLDSC
jgi:hypothetical protein